MSTQPVDLVVETGSYWATQFTWTVDGDPVPFTDPVMQMRQDLSPSSKLLAQLDQSGSHEGKLIIPTTGVIQAIMTADQTRTLTPGYGFWDMFINFDGHPIRFCFGTVAIAAHVTET